MHLETHVWLLQVSHGCILFTSAKALCETYEEDVLSQYGTTSFTITVIDDNDDSVQNGDAMLSGSGSSLLITSHQYIDISDFRKEDGSPGSVDLVSLSFTVDTNTSAVCYLVNSADKNLYPDGVSIYHIIFQPQIQF